MPFYEYVKIFMKVDNVLHKSKTNVVTLHLRLSFNMQSCAQRIYLNLFTRSFIHSFIHYSLFSYCIATVLN